MNEIFAISGHKVIEMKNSILQHGIIWRAMQSGRAGRNESKKTSEHSAYFIQYAKLLSFDVNVLSFLLCKTNTKATGAFLLLFLSL